MLKQTTKVGNKKPKINHALKTNTTGNQSTCNLEPEIRINM